jgi:glycosyltransferase involved in cell wall biosynthesis
VHDHAITDLRAAPGELSFTARIGDHEQRVWFRTDAPITPNADAALAACLMPAMITGGRLSIDEPISPRLLRGQWEFQAVQRAWSRAWVFGDPPLEDVTVAAPERPSADIAGTGAVAAFFSGGVDSWSTLLDHPEITHLLFVRGFDLPAGDSELTDRVGERLRASAAELGLPIYTVETNLRELSDEIVRWDVYYGCAIVSAALLLAPLFDRVLIAGDNDHEVQVPVGHNLRVDELLSTETTQIVDDGGRYSRFERIARIADHPVCRHTLRVCWENRDDAYNCGRCRKCLGTMLSLEALGAREHFTTFPPELDLAAAEAIEIRQPILLNLWLDVLDGVRAAGRADLERVVQRVVARGRAACGFPADYRRRALAGPPPTVRIGVVVPTYRQPQYLAAAVQSALEQTIDVGIGVVIVDDGCPFDSTREIAAELCDAHPEHVLCLHEANRGLSAARNTGIAHALEHWPHIEAIFPLDSDNLLSPHTLAELWELLEADPGADWVSPRLELMGAEQGTWYVPGRYLPYRQLFENQCDSGSLIRRRVLESGIAFDETMRQGYEDWEFFLHATLAGFTGVKAGECGFRYRRRAGSMVAVAQDHVEAIHAGVRTRHSAAYEPRALVQREHQEWPRFALARADHGDVLLTAACDLRARRLEWGEFARAVDDSGGGVWPTDELVAPITVLTTGAALDWLSDRNLLPGALLRLQTELAAHDVVELRAGERAALAARTRTLHLRGATALEPDAVVELHVGTDAPALWDDGFAGLGSGRFTGWPALPVPAHSHRLAQLHIDERETTLPWQGAGDGRDVLLVVPWLRADGAHRGAAHLLRAARAIDPALHLHLAVTDDTDLREVPLDMFETVTLGEPATGAHVVVHAGAPLPVAGAIHVALDESAARGLDALVDAHLAPSPAMAVRLANLEVVPDKIVLAPAAAVWRPEDPEHSRRLAADKNRRSGAPVILFRGPPDIRAALDLDVEDVFTPHALERADVVVFAGTPDPTLALDAMAFGGLVIACDAPGLADIVIHGETGVVVAPAELRDTIADAGAWADARDGGVERAITSDWEPAARALLDAVAAAQRRREPVVV